MSHYTVVVVLLFYLLCFIIQEFQQLKDQLHEKSKENKRIKENFDTLKMANDTLNKEVCRVKVQLFTLRLCYSEICINLFVVLVLLGNV